MSNLKFPEKLHFINKCTDALYTLHYIDTLNRWRCSAYYEQPKDWQGTYGAWQIEHKFRTGDWIRYYENEEERPLTLPVVVKTKSGCTYRVIKGTKPGWVHVSCAESGTSFGHCHRENDVRIFIKEGTWRVLSVEDNSQPAQEAVETSTSDDNKKNVITVKLDAEDAVKAVKAFAEALMEFKDVSKQLDTTIENTVKAVENMFGGK